MRNTKSLVILSAGLATLAAADGEMAQLAPYDVPVLCATMCGPVVELTGICHIGSHDMRQLKRRRLLLERERKQVYRRQFVTNAFGQLVPAPIPNAAKTVTQIITKTAVGADTVATRPAVAAAPAGALGDGGDDGDDDDGLPPLSPSQTPVAVGNAAGGSENLALDDGSTDMLEDMHAQTHKKEADAIEQAEEECICRNESFNVALVSALCSSCIQQSGDVDGREFLSSIPMAAGMGVSDRMQ